ncbi:hypothetical protein GGR42_001209 [Saonia flava]|uniref:CarboxypepD_reg-like domain-containing protein n=1 Tax=Saonia flava TaxID=523696 RepID=A0A846QU45_9FLAO|nr:carboxypeptidase-like regulatory domain-containing protein [Saonia flava]NJB70747.1 hypothetical protein [Saonia flava]
MRISKILFVFLFMASASMGAQNFFSHQLEGKVQSDNKDVADVHVMNTTTGRATITDQEGYFEIVVKLNDTLLFSAVQYKRKQVVISQTMLESSLVYVPLEEFMNELDEVVVRPFNLSGDLTKDMENLEIGPVVSASTLGLPNANAKTFTQSERLLKEASMPKFNMGMLLSLPFNPIINEITGRNKMLRKRVAIDSQYARTQRVTNYYVDSLYVSELKIPRDKIDDFMYFCEVDENFNAVVDTHDQLKIWEFLKGKSLVYRENNGLD